MPQPTAYSMSTLFTQLTGRKVSFTLAPAFDVEVDQVYGIYDIVLADASVIIQADLHLFGAFAGALMGLPNAVVKEQLCGEPMEELLRDAMHEVFNVISGAITDQGRTVFASMVMDRAAFSPSADECFRKPGYKSYFNVTVDGYTNGRFAIYAPFLLGGETPYWQG
jgi:hypothetical protein